METIFDYNPTKEEMARFGIYSDNEAEFRERKTLYLSFLSKEHNDYCLYILFNHRGDNELANLYYKELTPHYLNILVQDF